MGARQQKRRPLRTQVRIFGTDAHGHPFSRLAETLDVSRSGARLGGVFLDLRPGDEIDLEADPGCARYAIVWQGRVGTPHAGEVALRSVDASIVLWPDPDNADWTDNFDTTALAQERRAYRRFACDFEAEVTVENATGSQTAKCVDLSFGGCYLETPSPLPENTKLSVSIHSLPDRAVEVLGYTSSSHPYFGMGIRFTTIEHPEALAATMDRLRKMDPSCSETPLASPLVARDATGIRLGKKVLIVDDSLSVRNMMALHLRRHGYSVVLAKSGEEALEIVKSHHPDLILLDILMPRMSGLMVLRRLKRDPATRDIPVLVVSALSESNNARLIAEGACGYLAKATTPPDKLPAVLHSVFRSAR